MARMNRPVMVDVSNSMFSHLAYILPIAAQNVIAFSILENQHVRQMLSLAAVSIIDKHAFHG